jgi:hypothetical protein
VDFELKEISEKYFLQEKLDEKINFIVEPARYFLNNSIKTSPQPSPYKGEGEPQISPIEEDEKKQISSLN